MITLKLSPKDAASMLEALNEAISAQTFYLQVCRDDEDERSDEEIEAVRTLFTRLEAKVRRVVDGKRV